jgi:ankyrin repeat protein
VISDVNRADNDGQTPLHVAVTEGHGDEIILALIQFGADINALNEDNMTPLDAACNFSSLFPRFFSLKFTRSGEEKDWEAAKILIDKGGKSSENLKAVLAIFENDKEDLIRLMLQRGALEINSTFPGGTVFFPSLLLFLSFAFSPSLIFFFTSPRMGTITHGCASCSTEVLSSVDQQRVQGPH